MSPRSFAILAIAALAACRTWEREPAEPVGPEPAPPEAEPPAQPQRSGPHPVDRLEQARARYQEIVAEGGWPTVAAGKLEVGDTSPAVAAVQQRLAAEGDLPAGEAPTHTYTPEIAHGVARFQARYGLAPDGIVGPATRAAMNVGADQRLAQIDENLAAWRDVKVPTSGPWVVVNIPEFVLRAYEDDDEVLQMKVVVGSEYGGRATKSFSDAIDQVVFRPYWMVPPDIAAKEIVPDALANPDTFRSAGYQIVPDYDASSTPLPVTRANLHRAEAGDLRIRQAPGPDNALGRVKFLLPNEHAIYLHDTPEKHLFERTDRAASHGCIRVEDPEALASFVLGHGTTGWTLDRIDAAMRDGPTNQEVHLQHPVPIYIGYFTVWADNDGTVRFSEDLYDRFTPETAGR